MTSTKQTKQVAKEPIKLLAPKWSKVKDLERGFHGYNVKVQVLKVEKELLPHHGDKKITIVKAQVGDETGRADLLVKLQNPDLIKEGKVIAIRNGRRQIVKGHISLQLDVFGRITEEKDDIKASSEVNISEKEQPRRERRDDRRDDRRGDRDERRGGDRRGGDRDQRRVRDERRGGDRDERRGDRDERRGGDRRGDRDQRRGGDRRDDRDYDRRPRRDERPSKTVRVKDIGPGDEDLNLRVKVVELKERTENNNGKDRVFLDCVLADETGCVNASFFGNDDVRKGDVLNLRNVIAKVVREHIQVQRGREGRVSKADGDINNPNTTNNISKKAYELVD